MRYTREEYAPLDVRAAWPALPRRAESVESRVTSVETTMPSSMDALASTSMTGNLASAGPEDEASALGQLFSINELRKIGQGSSDYEIC